MPQLINVGILDANTLFRKTLKDYLSRQGNINVVVQCSDVTRMLQLLQDSVVHVLLIDISIVEMTSLETVKMVKQQFPRIKILFLTMYPDMELFNDLLDAGIYGIISKTDDPSDLINAIVSISEEEEEIYKSTLLTEAMYWSRQTSKSRLSSKISAILSEREKEILRMLWEEKSNKEIANNLFLSVRSVEKIRQDLKEKLGVKSSIGLIKYALSKKLIPLTNQFSQEYYGARKSG